MKQVTLAASLIIVAFITTLATGVHAQTSSNLLVNPGAEAGNLTGWNIGGPANAFVDTGAFNPGINPLSGKYDFVGGGGSHPTGPFGTLTQNVSLTGFLSATIANVSFAEQGLNQGPTSDNGYVSLQFLSSSNAVIGAASSPVIDSHGLQWEMWSGSFAIPAGTASINYTMNFTRHAGSDLDAYFDNNSLTVTAAVPEPETYAMMLAALGLLGVVVRRKRQQELK
jgi:hypothetical protein